MGGERLREARGIGIFLPALGNRSVDSDTVVRGALRGARTRARALSEGCGGGETPDFLNWDIS